MPDINLAPYDAQQQAINRRRQLAQALMQQSLEPIQEPSIPGAAISPLQGVAKMVQALMGGIANRKLDTEQKGFNENVLADRQAKAAAFARALMPEAQGTTATLPNAPTQAMPIPSTLTPEDLQAQQLPGSTPYAPPMPKPMTADGTRSLSIPASSNSIDRVQALAQALASPDPMQQQFGQAMTGGILSGQRADRAQQFEALQNALNRGMEQKKLDQSQANYESEASHRTAQERLAMELANKPKLVFAPQGAQPFMEGPGGITPFGSPSPKDEIPHTVTTDEGVMQWNPSTNKFDIKVGNRPPTAGQATANPPGDWTKTGDEFLKSIPAQWQATVKKLAHYDEDPTKVTSMRGGMREQVMQWVNQVNPGYKADEFSNRAPTRKAFTSGTQGQQINAINTAIGHIDMLTGLADKLQNGGFVPANAAFNTIKTMFGGNAVTNFDTLKDALAGEVASVLSKGSATVSGIADAEKKIRAASSPTQLAGYVSTLIPVMGSKLNALDYQYHQAMGAEDSFSALSPESKQILAKHGVSLSPPTANVLPGVGQTFNGAKVLSVTPLP